MMRTLVHSLWASVFVLGPLAAVAAPPARPSAPARPPVISSQQIDRYDAIESLHKSLQQNPKVVSDWVILGELAHEVAMDLPSDQAQKYFRMSREAWEKALELAPNKPGLKAAVKFARDQEAGGGQFEKSRDQLTQTYLDARRRDLDATDFTPAIRVYSPPSLSPLQGASVGVPTINEPVAATTALAPDPTPEANPPLEHSTSAAGANLGTRAFYNYTPYQPFYTPTGAAPYTYQQYSSAYYPPNYYGSTVAPPVTMQRYVQQYPSPTLNPTLNPTERQILRGAPRP